MTYYRLAMCANNCLSLKWKSTPLTPLDAVFRWLQYYHVFQQDLLRVFTASSREELNTLLIQENSGLLVSSVTAEQFLRQHGIGGPKMEQEDTLDHIQELWRMRTTTPTVLPSLSHLHMLEAARKQQGVRGLESRSTEVEMGAGDNQDLPYTFTQSINEPQLLAWTRLMVRVQQGELQP